jgi:signal transduction histidine kinase
MAASMQHNYKSVKCILGRSAQTNKEVIFDAHEGTIKVKSAFGQGAVFTVTLPI